MAIYSNLIADQGSNFSTIVTVEDNSGSPLDLTGYNFAGQIRKTYSSSSAVNFNIIGLLPLSNGEVQLSLTSEQTNSMKAGRYVYDFEIISSTSVVTRVLEGQLEITPSVTRV